jgi:pimeloyl-ACP methyl ester carboxylesterase
MMLHTWAWPWTWPWIAPGRSFAALDYGLPLRCIAVNDLELAVHERGAGKHACVLLHGLGSDMRVWSSSLAALGSRARVLAIDLPGFGKSSKPDASYALRWVGEHVIALLDREGIDRAVVFGHSMGGQVALQLALDHADRIAALVLSAPAGFERFSASEARWIRDAVDVDYTAGASAAAVVMRHMQAFHRMPVQAWPLLRDRLAIIGGPDIRTYGRSVARSVAAMLDAPVLDALADIELPVLVTFGTEDALIPNRIVHGRDTAALARQAVARLPDAQLVLVRDAGHMVQLERPDEWNAAVVTYLSRRVGW